MRIIYDLFIFNLVAHILFICNIIAYDVSHSMYNDGPDLSLHCCFHVGEMDSVHYVDQHA